MSRTLPLAGFQVTLIGRIWVTPEGVRNVSSVKIEKVAKGRGKGSPKLFGPGLYSAPGLNRFGYPNRRC